MKKNYVAPVIEPVSVETENAFAEITVSGSDFVFDAKKHHKSAKTKGDNWATDKRFNTDGQANYDPWYSWDN